MNKLKILPIMLLCLLTSTLSLADNTADKTIKKCLDVSVSVHTENGHGSGVIIKKGKKTFVLTCAHVVKYAQKTKKIRVNKKVKNKKYWVTVTVKKIYKLKGEHDKTVEIKARIVKFDDDADLAILRIDRPNAFKHSTLFGNNQHMPKVGEKIQHVGSMNNYTHTYTSGIITNTGVKSVGTNSTFDLTNTIWYPGSSGGGVFDSKGNYIGMAIRWSGAGLSLYIPMRQITKWLKGSGYESLITDDKLPSEDDLKKIPISGEYKKEDEEQGPPILPPHWNPENPFPEDHHHHRRRPRYRRNSTPKKKLY